MSFKKGKKISVASAMRINTLNQASTWPAKYTPIKLNENAQRRVTANK
ncbi:MAG: hypothetical protein JJW02_04630 [Pseudoalteromonas sp.]|nr:hypothetical protein [Pseudoalteromonas sp.]